MAGRAWVPREDAYLVAHRFRLTREQLADDLDRGTFGVVNRAAVLGISCYKSARSVDPNRAPEPTATVPTARRKHVKPAAAPQKTKKRTCLDCARTFESRGAGNRFCPTCIRTREHDYTPESCPVAMPALT